MVSDVISRVHGYVTRSGAKFVDRELEISSILGEDRVVVHSYVTVLYGPKGCGKTALFEALSRVVDPGSHRVLVVVARREARDEGGRVGRYVDLYAPIGFLEAIGRALERLARGVELRADLLSVRGWSIGETVWKLVGALAGLEGGVRRVIVVADELVEMAVAADTGRHTEKTLKLDRVIKLLHDDDEGRRRLAKLLAERGASFIRDEWFIEQYAKLKDVEKLDEWLDRVVGSLKNIEGAFVVVDEVGVVPYYMAKDIAHKLLAKGCNTVTVIYTSPENPGKFKVSIRVGEKSETDARMIAEPLGGGGHAKAAGVVLEEKDILKLLRKIAGCSPSRTVVYVRLQPFTE